MKILKRLQPHSFAAEDDLLKFGFQTDNLLPQTLRCLVWNMLKAKRRRWSSDFIHLIADRDLVLLQEAVADAPTDPMFYYSNRFNWVMVRSHRHPLSDVSTGVKTGSVAKTLNATAYFSPHREPLISTHKSMLATEYAIQDRTERLLVLNLHAINFVTVAKFRAHTQQVGQAIGQHSGPVLLAGDFNTWRPARKLWFDAMAKELGLNHTHWPRRTQLQHFHQHLDHVYFRDMLPIHAESLDHIRSSDHKPIAVTFRL